MFLTGGVFILFFLHINGQQLPVYSQYLLNEFFINPAVAGYDGRTIINVTGLKQWVGFTDPPSTYSCSVAGRILKTPKAFMKKFNNNKGFSIDSKGRIGLGASLYTDRNGLINRTGLQLTYAYHIFIRNSQLSFGLAGQMYETKINGNADDLLIDKDDPIFTTYSNNPFFTPDVALGVNYMTNKYHIGVSVSQLFESSVQLGKIDLTESQRLKNSLKRHYNLIWSYKSVINRNKNWEYEPSILIKGNESGKFFCDLTTRLYYKKEYWMGLSYRTLRDFVLMVGLKYEKFYFGYAFQYGINSLSQLTYGTHEISIAAKLGDSARRYRWLERY